MHINLADDCSRILELLNVQIVGFNVVKIWILFHLKFVLKYVTKNVPSIIGGCVTNYLMLSAWSSNNKKIILENV